MQTKQPNFLFISIDALRADRSSMCGYERPTTPNLSKLAESGVLCTETISTAAFTQASLPSMLTSTLPLSYGGYDNGATGRPPAVFKVMRDAGYETTILSTFPWVNSFFGYGDGLEQEHFLFALNSLVGIAAQRMRSSLQAYHASGAGDSSLIERIVPVIESLFDTVETYCDVRTAQEAINKADMAGERIMRDRYNFDAVKRVVHRHRRELRADVKAYVDTHLTRVPKAHEWVAHEWRYKRSVDALLGIGIRKLGAALTRPLAPGRAHLSEYRSKRYIDGAALTDRILRVLDDRDTRKPFFIWTHYLDTHVPYCPGPGANWKTQAPSYLDALGYDPRTDLSVAVRGAPTTSQGWADWAALYDAAVLYADEQIGRLVSGLKERGLADDTVIVVVGDHGEELGEHGDISHHFRMYEHNIRVPMLFSGADIDATTNGALTSTLDLAPTIAAIAGVEAPVAWEGASVFGSEVASRDHVIAEAFHSGNCLFDARPPYIAVRTSQHKFLWKEYRDKTDRFSPEGLELYDIQTDPQEKRNLYQPDHEALPELERYAAERLAAIPEITSARIVKALGKVGETAVCRIRGHAGKATGGVGS
ncbi:MAG: sulfatase-like hydrolase/transferase [Rhodospirillales bacterium]|nr:sulfatase-like hydrolase/transferase [Rhodospirillales bacterium]